MSEFQKTTVVFPVRDNEVLLAMKHRDFGEGWWNGYGGKVEDETFDENARRETRDESDLVVGSLNLAARLLFYFNDQPGLACQAYITDDFTGTPVDSDEMINPTWFNIQDIPYDTMWPGDDQWIPHILPVRPGAEVLNFAIYFNADKTFQRIATRTAEQVAEYFTENQVRPGVHSE